MGEERERIKKYYRCVYMYVYVAKHIYFMSYLS